MLFSKSFLDICDGPFGIMQVCKNTNQRRNIMKKISVIATLALLPMCGAFAGPGMNNQHNMNNNNMQKKQPTYWSVMEVVELPDKSPVVMRGRIKQNMGNEMFLFEDSTGTIMLEIEEEDWNGNTVKVDDIVTVYGNVDKGGRVAEIDVVSVEK